MRMKWFGLLVVLILLAACTPYQFKGTEYPEGIPAKDFTLTDTEGRPYQFGPKGRQDYSIVLGLYLLSRCVSHHAV